MNSNVQRRIEAISLRMQGFSYSEIMKVIPVPKGTLSGWLRHINLTNEQRYVLYENIRQKQGLARSKAAESNTKKRLARELVTREKAIKNFLEYKNNQDFIIGLTLYWAEGTKKDVSFSFINSDPEMIIFMYKWMIKYMNITKELIKIRLFIHLPYKEENLEIFWSNLLGIDINTMQRTIYKYTEHSVKKNQQYKGCIRMYINGIDYFRTIIAWKNELVNSLDI